MEANGKHGDKSKQKALEAAKDKKNDGSTQNKTPKKRRKVNHGKL